MRISDWSSDVCSSDLTVENRPANATASWVFRGLAGNNGLVLGCVLRLSLAFGGSHLVQFFFVHGLIHGFRSAFQLAFFRITPLGRQRGSGGFLLPLTFLRHCLVPSIGTEHCTQPLFICSGKVLQ